MKPQNQEKHSFFPLGDSAIRISFGETISPKVNREIRSFCEKLKKKRLEGVVEWLPSYTAVTVYYQPTKTTYHDLIAELRSIFTELNEMETPKARQVIVPVCYGGEFGPDIDQVASHNKLTTEAVIEIHSACDYLIYMLGFTPGFPYMGGMSKEISTPRLSVPRPLVPAGSVGIAGEQTGIYSLNSPGGWQIIGRTPLVLYDSKRESPSLFEAGDFVRFRSIEKKEFEVISNFIEENRYELQYEFIEE